MSSSDVPGSPSISELWRSVLQAVSITLVGLMFAAGLGLTSHALGSRVDGPDPALGARGDSRAGSAETLVAVATVAQVSGQTGQGPGTSGTTSGKDTTAPASADDPAEDGSCLDSAAGAAARMERDASAPHFDRAMTEMSAEQRAEGMLARADQALREDNRLQQDKRERRQAKRARVIVAEQSRLQEEKQRAQEARRLAEEAAAEAALAAPRGTLARSAEALARSFDRGTTVGSGTGQQAVAPIRPGSYRVAARYGAVGIWAQYHTGIDLSAPIGTPIRAAADGVVVAPVAGGWAGIHVIVAHRDGSTLSAHMMSSTVVPGQKVRAGDVIGFVGMTGRTFGPHLHFEYYPAGAGLGSPYGASDPKLWMAMRGISL